MTPAEVGRLLRGFRFGEVAARTSDLIRPGIVDAMRGEAPYSANRPHQTRRVKVEDRRHLRDTIYGTRTTTIGGGALSIVTDSPHAGFVVGGTKPHEIHPIGVGVDQPTGTGGHPLSFFWDKVDDFVSSFGWHGSPYGWVQHPGTEANKFHVRAWNLVKGGVAATFRDQVFEAFKKGPL